MSISTLQEYTRIAKYAKYLPEEKRRETWIEQVQRVFDMHREHFKDIPEVHKYIDEAEIAVRRKEVLGSQRVLQFGGDPIFQHNARLYNCAFGHINRPRAFQELMYLLLCGCGVGFSVQEHHVEQLPPVRQLYRGEKTFVVPDTIEGWADAIGVLVKSYFARTRGVPGSPQYRGHRINFDYSLIRPVGSPLSSGSKAPGPDGLRRSLELIRRIFDNALEGKTQAALRPIQVYDIIMHAADAVISGGVRRSATIALFSPHDQEMATAKTGRWQLENPQRGRSNNSALLVRDETSKQDFNQLMEWVREYGEPGFIWAEDSECGFNPCAEISLYPVDKHGNAGWQFCNLTEINGKKADTEENFYRACRVAAIIGTLQSAYTSFPYVGPVTENITKREALLGVSITGMMDSPDILFDATIQRNGAKIVREMNKRVADIIGVNQAARTTCVKPAGSTSCVLGTASGIHPHHAKRYFRRVQANKQENPVQHFKKFNRRAVECSVWDPNGVTEVITFLCEVPVGAKTKNQIDALKLLESVKLTQQNWVRYGTNINLCVRSGMRHNVSNTIHVKEHEWDDVADFIYKNRKDFAGVSLLPYSGDKDYVQAPFCAVPYPNDILREYGPGSFFASGIIEGALIAFGGDLWAASDAVLGTGECLLEVNLLKRSWANAAIKFAESHFDGDVRKMTYCLKDIYNLKLWEKLTKEYQDIDWTTMSEENNNVEFTQDSACAGGSCELPTEYVESLYATLHENK